MGAFHVVLDPADVADRRQELDLNSGSIQIDQRGIDWGDAAIQAYVANEQRWGSTTVSFRVPNRTVTIPLFVSDDDYDFDVATERLRQKVARFQAEGGWLKRETASGRVLFADVQNATLKFPDVWGDTGGVEPNVELQLECLPDFYGETIVLDTMVGAGELIAPLLYNGSTAVIEGDHPARCEVLIDNDSPADQLSILWAFRSRYYDVASTLLRGPSTCALSSGATVTPDLDTRELNAITLTPGDTSWHTFAKILGTEVGSYQVWARVRSSGPMSLRGVWSIGDATNTVTNDQVAIDSANTYRLVNLGQVRLDQLPVGAQVWILSVQAQGNGQQIGLSDIYLQPLDEAAGQIVGSTGNPVILANRDAFLRYDQMYRQTLPGFHTPLTPVSGDLPRLPPSGMEERPVEAFFRVSRGDLGSAVDSPRDPFAVSVTYRPCYLSRL